MGEPITWCECGHDEDDHKYYPADDGADTEESWECRADGCDCMVSRSVRLSWQEEHYDFDDGRPRG